MATAKKPRPPIEGDPDYGVWKIGYDQGLKEGTLSSPKDFVIWLENRYMSPDIERGTPEAQALLTLMNAAGKYIRGER